MPDALTTFPHFTMSSRSVFANSTGVPGSGSAAGTIVDDDLLTEHARIALRDRAREGIRSASWHDADQEADRTARVIYLRERHGRCAPDAKAQQHS